MSSETIANIVKIGWFGIVLGILVLYILYRRSKVKEFGTHIELEKVTNHDKYDQLDDASLLKLTNDNNKSRPGSPSFDPTKRKP